jgi:hypothetical protein
MVMLPSRMKWRLTVGALVTLPAAFWYLGYHPRSNAKLVIAVAFIPIFIGMFIELRDQWRVAGENPEQLNEGSPVGNAIAWVLAVPLALLLLYVVYRMIAGIT